MSPHISNGRTIRIPDRLKPILVFLNPRTSQLELLLLSRPLVTLADTLVGAG